MHCKAMHYWILAWILLPQINFWFKMWNETNRAKSERKQFTTELIFLKKLKKS